jgi:hypothetical protein
VFTLYDDLSSVMDFNWFVPAREEGHRVQVEGLALSLRSPPDWLKMKNPKAAAVKREEEEDWGKRRLMGMLTRKSQSLLAHPSRQHHHRLSRYHCRYFANHACPALV